MPGRINSRFAMFLSAAALVSTAAAPVRAQQIQVAPDANTVFTFSGFEGEPFLPDTLTTWKLDNADPGTYNSQIDVTNTTNGAGTRQLPVSLTQPSQIGSLIGPGGIGKAVLTLKVCTTKPEFSGRLECVRHGVSNARMALAVPLRRLECAAEVASAA